MIIVFVTVPNTTFARFLGKKLLHEGLAKCVNTIPVVSSFIENGSQEERSEQLLIIKTVESNFTSIEKRVKQLHPYKVPEIIAISVVKGSKDYLNWVKS
ncbi:MAG: divalent-cation tolerance protein CutA [Candidatus Diapherotrites archaeon]|nr:divalent-cation tolerance protein CutA [Candidatus Diapherotrites archaeon]